MPAPDIFISYSRKDKKWLDDLVDHLKNLEIEVQGNSEKVTLWFDNEGIETGQRINEEVQAAINSSKIAILLVSKKFKSSKFITEKEIPTILKRKNLGHLKIFPVLIEEFNYENYPPLRDTLLFTPESSGKSFTFIHRKHGQPSIDKAFTQLTKEVLKSLKEIKEEEIKIKEKIEIEKAEKIRERNEQIKEITDLVCAATKKFLNPLAKYCKDKRVSCMFLPLSTIFLLVMAVDIYQQVIDKIFPDKLSPEMVQFYGGDFIIGCHHFNKTCHENEKSLKKLNIRPFEIGKFEVTFEEWDRCFFDGGCQHYPSDQGWGRGIRPVINVNWYDVQQYIQWLNKKTGLQYRLPTEAEWEFTVSNNSLSLSSHHVNCSIGNFGGKSCKRSQTKPVGSYEPYNDLHDIYGNVWEWLQDCYHQNYSQIPIDGKAWENECHHNDRRMIRGGSWSSPISDIRPTNRAMAYTDQRADIFGFRLCRTLNESFFE